MLDPCTIKIYGGPVEFGTVDKNGLWTPGEVVEHNLTMLAAGDILAKLVGGASGYQISHMYFEFTNGVVPSVTPVNTAGVSYYNALDGVTKDYIRAPLVSAALYDTTGSPYLNNIARFFGITSGVTGIHGLAYSQSATSKVYGAALVASPTGLQASDIVFARIYPVTASNKTDGTQVGVRWGVSFS